uniref:Riboflavin synthase n=1 Tax=Geoglobus ahangari TaxID=113653 RepID=A0A7C4WDC0_9EURY
MKIGIVDTTFSRVNMGDIAIDELKNYAGIKYVRRTVPGIKDLPVEAKRLLDEGCDIVITLGWVGKSEKDALSYLAMSIGKIIAELMTNKHIIDVTVHEDEAEDEKTLLRVAENRVREHVRNAVDLIRNPNRLIKQAGTGQRQGFEDVGPILR